MVATESKAGQATSSTISRQAMDHLQATSLSDIMQLLPGGVIANPDLSKSSGFTLRTVVDPGDDMKEADDNVKMNSLGTAIFMDGHLSQTIQIYRPFLHPSPECNLKCRRNNTGAGFDISSISTDHIESIEVIRGIPSVEYGDLTSELFNSFKSGREPLTVDSRQIQVITRLHYKGSVLRKEG